MSSEALPSRFEKIDRGLILRGSWNGNNEDLKSLRRLTKLLKKLRKKHGEFELVDGGNSAVDLQTSGNVPQNRWSKSHENRVHFGLRIG